MAVNYNDQQTNNAANNLTNHGSTEWLTDFPFAASTEAVQLVSSTNQYLTAADSSSLSITGDLTIEGWFKFDAIQAEALVSKYDTAGPPAQQSFLFYLNNAGTLRFYTCADGTNTNAADSTGTVSTGVWTHVAVTYNHTAGTCKFYIGGAFDSNGSGLDTSLFDSNALLAIGAYYDGLGPQAHADFKATEIRIWNTERTSGQISANYNIHLTGSEAGLVAYYPFETITSPSSSASKSLSPSASISPSASVSPSASSSASASKSASKSASASASASVSASPSVGYTDYTRENNPTLPTDSADLTTNYSAQDVIDVSSDDGVRVAQTGTTGYLIHEFKNFVGSRTSCILLANLQSSLAPTSSSIKLEIYNVNSSSWETVSTNNTSGANTDFDLQSTIPDLTNYKDSDNRITCRIYQLII